MFGFRDSRLPRLAVHAVTVTRLSLFNAQPPKELGSFYTRFIDVAKRLWARQLYSSSSTDDSRLSFELPIVVEIVDTQQHIDEFLPILDGLMSSGNVTLEKAALVRYPPSERLSQIG